MLRSRIIVLIPAIILPAVSRTQIAASQLKEHLKREWIKSGNPEEDLEELLLSSCHQSSLSGITHAYFQQSYGTIPVCDGLGSIHLSASGSVAYVNFHFYKNLKRKIKTATARISTDKAWEIAAHSAPTADLLPAKPSAKDGRSGEKPAYLKLDFLNRTRSCNFNPDEIRSPESTIYHSAEENLSTAPNKPSDIYPTRRLVVTGAPKYFAFPFDVESPAYGSRQLLAGSSSTFIAPVASRYGRHKASADPVDPEYSDTQGNHVYAYYAPTSSSGPAPVRITRAPFTGTYLYGNVPWPNHLNFDYRHDLTTVVANSFPEDAVTNVFVRKIRYLLRTKRNQACDFHPSSSFVC